jgi:hypothetical protein
MSEEDDKRSEAKSSSAVTTTLKPVVVRSTNLPTVKEYGEYLPVLRKDFWYSCAYCTITEAEARAIRFEIDHYEPVSARDDLRHEYSNLMYACEECNSLKGDRTPPQSARDAGKRFFRVDEDIRSEHFEPKGIRVEGKTTVGEFTVDAVDLNRYSLRRLREIRQKLMDSEVFVSEGVTALSSFAIDRLSPQIRGDALAAINKALELTDKVFGDFDELLLEFAKSPLLQDEESDEDRLRNKERLARLREQEGLHPGVWRGRNARKKRH